MKAKHWIVLGLVPAMALTAMATPGGPVIVTEDGNVLTAKAARSPRPVRGPAKLDDVEAKNVVVEGNNAFALDLYAKLAEKDKGNLFFSPNSIHTALGMTYAGARGKTAEQMAEVLHFGFQPQILQPGIGGTLGRRFTLPPERLHPAFAKLIKQLNTKGKKSRYQLSIANRLWGQKGYPWKKEFLKVTKANYDAGLQEVDFVQAAEAARKAINAWVEKQTQQKIKDLLQKGDVDRLTVLVLTNAIYFKGDWASKFKKEHTKDAPFKLGLTAPRTEPGGPLLAPPLNAVSVPMMNQKAKFGYMETRDFQALEMPYAGEELSMIVFLPRKVRGLKEFEKSLTSKNLSKWLASLRKRDVVVHFPRFKMTCRFKLKPVLKSMGMTDAFSPAAADFSGMTTMEKICISKVIHKAFVDVNEEGTEAAAATVVIMAREAAIMPAVFRADHPFVFMIRDKRTGSILFLGRVMNPKA